MNRFLKFTSCVVLLIIILPIAFFRIVGAKSKFDYEKVENYTYYEGCPYPFEGAYCRWTKEGYSGFNIGMSKEAFFKYLCLGKSEGTYFGPFDITLDPKKSDISEITSLQQFKSYEISSHKGQKSYSYDDPCQSVDFLAPLIGITFERNASDWELKKHREIFHVKFVENSLSLVQVHRTFFYIDP